MKRESWRSLRSVRVASGSLVLFLLVSGTAGAFTRPDPYSDTSTPTNTLVSYYNAIDRGELARAYGYVSPQAHLTFHQFDLRWTGVAYVRLEFARVAGYVQASPMQASVCVNVRVRIAQHLGRPQRFRGWYTMESTTGEEPNFGGWRIDLDSSRLTVIRRGQTAPDSCHII
jgi:hypothetical protein